MMILWELDTKKMITIHGNVNMVGKLKSEMSNQWAVERWSQDRKMLYQEGERVTTWRIQKLSDSREN